MSPPADRLRPGARVPPEALAVRVVLGTFAVVCATLAIALFAGRPVAGELAAHVGVAVVVLVVARVVRGHPSERFRSLVIALCVVGAMFFLYGSLGRVAFAAVPWNADAWLRSADRLLGWGHEPAEWVGLIVEREPWAVEPLALFYAAFIPYLYLTIFLGLAGRPERTRGVFVLAFALLYGSAFMGYLFLPARGPIVSMVDVLPSSLAGGAVLSIVVGAIDAMGGPHGAFPSLHIGASSLAALTDLRHGDTLRGAIYLPLIALIAIAAVALRYHYVVDLLAGAGLAFGALVLAERWSGAPSRGARGRERPLGRTARPSVAYRVCRALLRASMLGFFRRVEIQDSHRIPRVGPVLIVANHTNAFVDPLVLLTGMTRRVTLTAKSTLAHNPLLAPLLRAFDVVLFHRAGDEDPDREADHNERALSECAKRLRRGDAVLVFPEGVSHSDPGMRSFKTGAARIAELFRGLEPEGELTIVPVGLHYSRKDAWRSDAVAWVGHPVELGAWLGVRRAADVDGVDAVALTADIRTWIEALTEEFASVEERTLVDTARALLAYRPEGPPPLDQPLAMDAEARVLLSHSLRRGARALRSRDPSRLAALSEEAVHLSEALERRGVSAEEVGLPIDFWRAALFVLRELEILLVGAPLAFAGWITNLPALWTTKRLVRRMSHDEDHTASNAVFIGMPVFLLWWLGCVALGLAFLDGWWPLAAAAVAPLTGALSLRYRDRAGGVVRRVRTFLRWLVHPEDRRSLAVRIEEWVDDLRSVQAELHMEPPEAEPHT